MRQKFIIQEVVYKGQDYTVTRKVVGSNELEPSEEIVTDVVGHDSVGFDDEEVASNGDVISETVEYQ
jgi:hypothetical protein